MNIARQAQLEEAVAEQKETILTLSSGLELKIPVGARHVGIPNSISAEHPKGLMVEVYWDLDHSGVLTISGYSPEFPVS